jgi:uroporphyrinogen-III synthase
MATCPPLSPEAASPLVLVTRPAAQARSWVEALVAEGIRAEPLPLIDIAAAVDPQPVHAAWHSLASLRFVMFVSANAVEQFFAARPAGAVWPAGLRAGATGPGTAQALRAAGLAAKAIVMPARPSTAAAAPAAPMRWDSEALWACIAGEGWAGQQVLVVRGEQGRDWLAQQWRDAGAAVRFVEAYRRGLPRWSPAERALCAQAVAQPQRHLWLFSSSEAIGHLLQLAPPGTSWQAGRAWVTHERIAAAATGAGFGSVHLVGSERHELIAALREGPMTDRSVQSAYDS